MARAGVDESGKRLDIGAEQLLQPSVTQNVVDDGRAAAQLGQHLFRGDILARLGLLWLVYNLHLAKENISHLLGTGYIECLASLGIYLLFVFGESAVEVLACLCQCGGVQAYSGELHLGQYGHQWHLDVVEEAFAVDLLELLLEHVLQSEGHVGILGSILINFLGLEVTHRPLTFTSGSDELVDVYRLVAQQRLGHVVHVVVKLGLHDVVGEHGVEHGSAHLYPITTQHLVVVLDVLSYLHDVLRLVERTEDVDYALRRFPLCGHGDIDGLEFFDREAQTDQFGVDGVGRCRFCIKTQDFFCQEIITYFSCFFF